MDTWENFLADILPDSAHREFVRRLGGFGYLADVTEPVMAVFCGAGPNGKTTFARALSTALGITVMDGQVPQHAPQHFTIVVVNHAPWVPGPALLVPFPVKITRDAMDYGMRVRLSTPEVQDAIRSWAYDGYLDCLRQGLNPPPGITRLAP